MISSVILKGNKYFKYEDAFTEFTIEITDGCELIGLCLYDINKNYMDIFEYKDINILVHIHEKHIDPKIGNLWINVFPKYKWNRESLTIGFAHNIQFKPVKALRIMEIRETLM